MAMGESVDKIVRVDILDSSENRIIQAGDFVAGSFGEKYNKENMGRFAEIIELRNNTKVILADIRNVDIGDKKK